MNEKLTFKELTEAVAAATQWSKSLTHIFIKEMFAVIVEGLENDGEVKLKGLGWFKLRWVEPRMGRNPQTGEPLLIPGYRKVLFRPEKSLRDLVNRRFAHLKPIFLKEEAPTEAEPQPNVIPLPTVPEVKAPQEITASESETKTKRNRIGWILLCLVPLLLLGVWLLLQQLKPKMPTESVISKTTAAEIDPKEIKPAVEPQSHETQPASSVKTHLVRPGDTLWDMAFAYYDEHLFWPLIYRSNRATLSDPDFIEPQQTLTVEALEGSRRQLTRTDSVRLSEGYHLVYLAYKEKNKRGAEAFEQVAARFK